MDFFQILSTVNKVSLVLFVITFIALCYEFYIYKKTGEKVGKLKIPRFDASITTSLPASQIPRSSPVVSGQKNNIAPVVIACALLLFIFGASILAISLFSNESKSATPVPREVAQTINDGVYIYTLDWQEISNQKLNDFEGQVVYIGLQTIQGGNIDRARIRINKKMWTSENETTLFNQEKNVYYIQYRVPSEESRLHIEGQLHSAKDGWPEK